MKKTFSIFFLFLAVSACKERSDTLFVRIDSEVHGIDFKNVIDENDSLNILTLEYIYNGGGVAVADFNNDGLQDIFLTGNIVPNALYLNLGGLRFRDISGPAGIGASEKWKSGVAVADVNADGLMDIYVCATIHPDSTLRQNMLFINQGVNADGIPVFRDEAAAYKVNYSGHSSGAAFLDYDNDGDLDLYIITNAMVKGIPTSYRPKINDGTINADVLYKNNGDGTFSNVSREAGILYEGYGLGLAIADVNLDGWQDIYVGNDYITNDLLYINNQDGTFTNAIDHCIKHQSQFSMGNDIADFNNDGYPDIITLDMLPENNLRRKTVINGTSYASNINNEKYGYSPQHIRNVLQLNNGDGTFSEIGQLAGVHQTEWSWSPLFADLDNDGWKDILVTNGFPRDVTDKDFGNFRAETRTVASVKYQIDSIPVVKVANYVFRNQGNLTFKDVTEAWGMHDPAFSNGAAFADLDNDGDLDYIVNNINDEILLYENRLYHKEQENGPPHYLRVKLQGNRKNTSALGAKVTLKYGKGSKQYHDHSIYRGYISTVEDIIHFGLDTVTTVDTLLVEWPDGQTTLLTDVQADRLIDISHNQSKMTRLVKSGITETRWFSELSAETNIEYLHREVDKIDFNIQRTIPHKLSQSGPGLAVGDTNGDGLEDLYVGGSAEHHGMLFVQRKDGTFRRNELPSAGVSDGEDQGALFFDADNDNDLDLYIVSGTFEFEAFSSRHQDKLFINDGDGNYRHDPSALPKMVSSGSCVRAVDFDGDGDLDLFVGGRVVPGQYPMPPESYLLVNEGGKFTNRTEELAPDLTYAGMITDGLWTDINNDQKPDLVVAGEFMPLMLFVNRGDHFQKVSDSGLENFSGWWNSLAAADFDMDGDIDLVAGNLGYNNYYRAGPDTPLRVYAKDFDGNSSIDAVLSCYLLSEEGEMKEYPVHFWDELTSQSPKFRKKFQYYKQYGRATMDKLLSEEERKGALLLSANHTASSYFENDGSGKFRMKALPMRSQIAPVNGLLATDVNQDGIPDVVLVGNDYGNEVFTGRHDAFTGLILLGDGRGNFSEKNSVETGFVVPGDAKALAKLRTATGDLFVASQNRDSLKIFKRTDFTTGSYFIPEFLDIRAVFRYEDGKEQAVEFYYGSGYLSQSTRSVEIPRGVNEIIVYNSKGQIRRVVPEML